MKNKYINRINRPFNLNKQIKMLQMIPLSTLNQFSSKLIHKLMQFKNSIIKIYPKLNF